MRQSVSGGSLFVALALAASIPASARDVDQRGVVVRPITSADVNLAGQPIEFPRKDGHVTAALYEIAPGVTLPVHRHPYPRMGYVLSGTLRVTDVDHARVRTFTAGQFIIESVNTWHRGENVGPDPLKLLVIDLTEKGAEQTILKKEPGAERAIVR